MHPVKQSHKTLVLWLLIILVFVAFYRFFQDRTGSGVAVPAARHATAFDGQPLVGAQVLGRLISPYELTERHFGWEVPPEPARERETLEFLLDRALRSQGVVGAIGVCGAARAQLDEVIARAREAGVAQMMVTGTAVDESMAAAKLADEWGLYADLVEEISLQLRHVLVTLATCSQSDWLVGWLLSFRLQAQVLAPKHLKDRVAGEAQKISARYTEEPRDLSRAWIR